MGQKFKLRQTLSESRLPLGISRDYIAKAKPHGLFRLWLRTGYISDFGIMAGTKHDLTLRVGTSTGQLVEWEEGDTDKFGGIFYLKEDLSSLLEEGRQSELSME